jgi:hypothetical protein
MIKVSITDKVSQSLRAIQQRLDGPGKAEASQAMGIEAQITVCEHLSMLAASRHDTANRLGASPSNFLATAVDAAAASGVLSSDYDSATLTLRHPAIARAFRDISIEPKTAKALTIPINAIAYNRRAGQFEGIFRMGGKPILAIKQGDSVLPLFLLVRSVTQKQDRSLMPSDDELANAGARGLTNFIHGAMQASNLS